MEKRLRNKTFSRLFILMTIFALLLGGSTYGVFGDPEAGPTCVCGDGKIEEGEECEFIEDCLEGEVCIDCQCVGDICEPDCSGKQCGDDGCGGTCGECAEPNSYCDGNAWVYETESCVDYQCLPASSTGICFDGDPCTADICKGGDCIFPFIDEEGPITSNVFVDPYFNNGIFDLTAIATDTCSNIEESEYFVGHVVGDECGEPGTGTPMDPFDGNFNSLMEDLIKEDVNYLEDGLNWVCVQSKDVADNWGNCECAYYESDTIPPLCPFNMAIGDELYPDEYLICGDSPMLSADVCDEQAGIQGGEYFIDPIIPPIPPPWSGFWMDVDYTYEDPSSGMLCAHIEAQLETEGLEDGTHYVKLRGKDTVENWGKISQCMNISFIKDTTPPVTSKKITFVNDTFVACEYEEMMGETITDGCYYTLPGAQIHLSSYDPDPQGTGEFAGDVVIHYIVWWSYDGSEWEIVDQGSGNIDEDVYITLQNDSYHLVEYWATDGCTWEEEHHFELDIIDTKAPILTKTVGKPQVSKTEQLYITQDTEITFECEDQEPHPVDDVTIKYRTRWKEDFGDEWGIWSKWAIFNKDEVTFDFDEDSIHEIEYACFDALGNSDGSHFEIDIVDTEAPETTKEIVGPKLPGYKEIDWFITDETKIIFNCTDPEPHPVDDVTLYWKVWWKMNSGDSWELIESGNSDGYKEFTDFGESYHKFEYWCVDALGNEEKHRFEIDAVDTRAPHTTKKVGEPKVLMDPKCNPQEEICDYWISQNTEITLECEDVEPHPIGGETLYWRDYLEGDEPGMWNIEEDGHALIQKDEDCLHVLEWYCTDALDNSEGTPQEPIIEYDNVDTAPPEIHKFVIKDGERIYAPEEGVETVAIQSGEILKFCADVNDVKLTGDPGVGVWKVGMQLTGLPDPELLLDEGEQAYCKEWEAFEHCGYYHYEVRAKDLLGNEGEWTDGIEIIVDNVPPIGEVLHPHAGDNYYPGKIFSFYAPAVDFGGDYCSLFSCGGGQDCPASGVDYCDVYAIDFDFEALDQDEIKNCYWDLWEYFDQVLEDPYIKYIGRVPYENGVCNGYLTIPEDSELTDVVFMAVDWVDKAGNSRFGLALNPWFSPITMNMEEIGYMKINEMFESPVTSNDLLTVKASLFESGLSGNKECVGIVEKYEGEKLSKLTHIITYPGEVTGNVLEGFECTITGNLPDYEDLDSGYYRYTVEYRLNDDLQVFEIDSESFNFVIDNDRPDMSVLTPEKGETYGEVLPVSLYLEDNSAGIVDETVLVRLHEMGIFGTDFCWGGCEDTGWVLLNSMENGYYSEYINLSDYDITGEPQYNFDAIACDSLYDSEDLAEGVLPIIPGNDRNGHHCRRISIHGADASYEAYCGDGIVTGEEACEYSEDCEEGYYCDECTCMEDLD